MVVLWRHTTRLWFYIDLCTSCHIQIYSLTPNTLSSSQHLLADYSHHHPDNFGSLLWRLSFAVNHRQPSSIKRNDESMHWKMFPLYCSWVRSVIWMINDVCVLVREYWIIYRGPGFLAFLWFGSSPTPSPPVSKFDRRHTGRFSNKDKLLTGRGEGWGGESKIIRRRESLVIYKSFNALWSTTAELETIMIPSTGSHACISSFRGHFALIWNDLKARCVQIVPVLLFTYRNVHTLYIVMYKYRERLFHVKYSMSMLRRWFRLNSKSYSCK